MIVDPEIYKSSE